MAVRSRARWILLLFMGFPFALWARRDRGQKGSTLEGQVFLVLSLGGEHVSDCQSG
jgi:hypothetical protein